MGEVTLRSGQILSVDESRRLGVGSFKEVLACSDRSLVVARYLPKMIDSKEQLGRLELILGKFNPTVLKKEGGGAEDATEADYYRSLFCWPIDTVLQPKLGVLLPHFADRFFFKESPWRDAKAPYSKLKTLNEFINRHKMREGVSGTLLSYLQIGLLLSRAVKRLHIGAGLTHTDLSANNVLIDPADPPRTPAACCLFDNDMLAVRGSFAPRAKGTAGYIAPEIVTGRAGPSVDADKHSLSVILYRMLFGRHPLLGKKLHSDATTLDENETLSLGDRAVFVEHPSDDSNRPDESIKVPLSWYGEGLASLFLKAFVTGIHSPAKRPLAVQWEDAFVSTIDHLYPCGNDACTARWFVIDSPRTKIVCPWCKWSRAVPVIFLRFATMKGVLSRSLTVWRGGTVNEWHLIPGRSPGPHSARTPLGLLDFDTAHRMWVLDNQQISWIRGVHGATSDYKIGDRVPLQPGTRYMYGIGAEPVGLLEVVKAVT